MAPLFLVSKALFSMVAAPMYIYRTVLGAGFSDPWAGAWKLGQERRARKRNTPSWFPSTKFFESSNDAYGRGTVFILNTQGWKPLFRKLHKNAAGEWRSQHTHPRRVTPQSDGGHVSLPRRSPARSQSSGSSPGREKRPAGKERGVRAPVCLPDPGFGAEM